MRFKFRNFRDLGGLCSRDGRMVRKGLFLRSGKLTDLSLKDMEFFKKCRLGTIIDLRTPGEVKDEPDTMIKGSIYKWIPIFEESVLGLTPHFKGKSFREINKLFSKEQVRKLIPDMPKLYQDMILDSSARRQIGEIIRLIMDNVHNDMTTLFHCTSGKDRTGVISAILLSLLGVEDNDIVNDYLLSNTAVRRRATFIGAAVALFKRDLGIARDVRNALMADRANIDAVLQIIRERFGSVEEFIRDELGISDFEIWRFRQEALA